jgi:hypothetical protein
MNCWRRKLSDHYGIDLDDFHINNLFKWGDLDILIPVRDQIE